MEETASRKKIASLAGVSKTTVTRVLSGSKSVSKETRTKVLKIVEELGYAQNKMAINVSKKKNSNIIAMLLPDMSNYYYLEMFNEIVKKTENTDYTISVYKISETNFNKIIESVVENRVSAIINLSFTQITVDQYKKIKSAKIGIIHPGIGKDPLKINIDYSIAIEQVFDELIKKGCSNFRFLCGIGKKFMFDGRIKSFLNLVTKYELPYDENSVLWGEINSYSGIELGYEIIKDLLKQNIKTDVLFCLTDMMALGASRAIQEKGLVVGKDISLIGFDNILFGQYSVPFLSTIDSNIKKEAGLYVDYILGKEITDNNIISKYIKRSSTR